MHWKINVGTYYILHKTCYYDHENYALKLLYALDQNNTLRKASKNSFSWPQSSLIFFNINI